MNLRSLLPAPMKKPLRRLLIACLQIKDPAAYRVATWRFGDAPRVRLPDAVAGTEDVDVTVRRAFARTIDTSIDPYELFVLCALERALGASRVLEIGTFDGGTALNLAANLADGGRVTTVDLPPDWNGQLAYDVPPALRNFTGGGSGELQYRGTPEEERIRQVHGDSAQLDWSRLGGPFDLVFIDGCHYYEYVRKDTENALVHLRRGGVVVWHDYGLMDDVSRAVDEFQDRLDIVAISGTRIAVGTSRSDAPSRQA